MQPLARTSSLGTSYTAAQVIAQLGAGSITETFKFYRLNAAGVYQSDLSPYVDENNVPQVTHDTTAAVRRTHTIYLRGDTTFNVLTDQIQVVYLLQMPDGGTVNFTVGTFVMLPTEKDIMRWGTLHQLQCADYTQLLVDGKFSSSVAISAGTNYISAINSIIQSYGGSTPLKVEIPDPGLNLPAALGWEYGETRLKAVNDLLSSINFFPLWADEIGILRSAPIPDWNLSTPSYTFDATSASSNVKIPFKDIPDFSRSFNQCLVVGEDPRRVPVFGYYENDRPDSPVSIPNWHPKLEVIRDSSVPDAPTAVAKAKTAVQEAARINSEFDMETFPWPVSQDQDVYGLIYNTSDTGLVIANYVEFGWIMNCRTGASTLHKLTRIYPA